MNKRIISLILFILVVVCLILSSYIPVGVYNPSIIEFCICIVAFSLFLWFIYQQNSLYKNIWHRPSNLMLMGMIVVYFQYIIDLLIGYKTPDDFVYPNIINISTSISAIGVVSYILGYLISNNSFKIDITLSKQKIENSNVPISALVIIHILCFLFFLSTINIASFISGNIYTDSMDRVDSSTYSELLFNSSNILLIVFSCKNKDITNLKSYFACFPKISLTIIILYLLLRLFSGDRGPVITICMLIFFTYINITKKRIKLFYFLLMLSIGALSISIIGIARVSDLNQSFVERVSSGYDQFLKTGRFENQKSIIPYTEELASSHLSHQIICGEQYVKNDNNTYGQCQLIGILGAIPFMSGFIHNYMGISKEYSISAYYATYRYVGYNPTWGTGTNIISDFFLDFGLIGMSICMFLIGMIFKKIDLYLFFIDKKNISNTIFLLIMIIASNSFYLPRANFLNFLKSFVFCILILAFCKIISRINLINHNSYGNNKKNQIT